MYIGEVKQGGSGSVVNKGLVEELDVSRVSLVEYFFFTLLLLAEERADIQYRM